MAVICTVYWFNWTYIRTSEEEVHHSCYYLQGNILEARQYLVNEPARVRNKSPSNQKNDLWISKSFPRYEEESIGETAIYFKNYFLKVFVQTIGAICRLIDLMRSKGTIPTSACGWEVPWVRSEGDYDKSLVVISCGIEDWKVLWISITKSWVINKRLKNEKNKENIFLILE